MLSLVGDICKLSSIRDKSRQAYIFIKRLQIDCIALGMMFLFYVND